MLSWICGNVSTYYLLYNKFFNTTRQIQYQEKWKSVFEKALRHVNTKILQLNECSHSNVCMSCRNSMIARITELERFETLSELTTLLENKDTRYPNHTLCNPCRNNTCIYQAEVTDICLDGIIDMPPFTEFLSRL